MIAKRQIKVLIVDDSLLFRETLAQSISLDPGIVVVGTASDPYMARDKILETEPDVMILDVELPKMNGIEFLRRLMPQYPLPVIVVSSVKENVFEALRAGAVDFVAKPEVGAGKGIEGITNELIIKTKIASVCKVGQSKAASISKRPLLTRDAHVVKQMIAIGASTGGTEAIYSILHELPITVPGIVITQHMPPGFTNMFAQRLNNSCILAVKEAKDGDQVEPGTVLIAPGDRHMKVTKMGNRFIVKCVAGEKVNGHCPSVDVLFESVALAAGAKALGVILTGMGNDGAKGLLSMRNKGAFTIGQDEKSCVVYGMPKVAHDIGALNLQVGLDNMPSTILAGVCQ